MQATLQEKRDIAYQLASRHSARVLLLRVAVPAAALLMTVFLVLAIIVLRPGSIASLAGFQLDGLTIDDGKLVMSNPRLEGVADGGRPYTVQAERAVQAGPNADLIELVEIFAEIDSGEPSNVTLEAKSGIFEREANLLRLTDRAVFTRTGGIEAYFNSADIEIGTGSMVSNEPVRIVAPGQEILAGAAEFTDSGKRALFSNGVRVTVTPQANSEEAGEQQ